MPCYYLFLSISVIVPRGESSQTSDSGGTLAIRYSLNCGDKPKQIPSHYYELSSCKGYQEKVKAFLKTKPAQTVLYTEW